MSEQPVEHPKPVEPTTPEAASPTQEPVATPEGTPTDEPKLSQEDWQKEAEKARKEAAKYRTRLREREEAEQKAAEEKRKAELSAEERAKEAERKAQEATEAAEARVRMAELRADLAGTGRVSNPTRLLALMQHEGKFDELVGEGGPNVDAILEAYPEYAKDTGPAPKTPAPGAGGATPKPVGLADLSKLTPEEFAAKRDEIYANLKR